MKKERIEIEDKIIEILTMFNKNGQVKELSKASDYIHKSDLCISNFEKWIRENIDGDFDFDTLRAMSYEIDDKFQTEALTDIEHGRIVDVEEIERVLNYWVQEKSR